MVVAYRVSWPDQLLIRGTLADIAAKVREAGIGRQALIIVSPALNEGEGSLTGPLPPLRPHLCPWLAECRRLGWWP